MKNDQININILGTTLTLKSDEDPAYLKKILTYFEATLFRVQNDMKVTDPLKAAIIAGIFLSDEINKLENQVPKEIDENNAKSKILFQLIDKLNDALN